MLKIGIVGCGTIGAQLAKAIAHKKLPGLRLAGVNDIDPERARALAVGVKPKPRILVLSRLAQASDVVVEAAGMASVPAIAAAALACKKDLVVMSVGALILHPEWPERFSRAGCRLYFPSGAVAGLDGLRAAARGGLQRVRLITRKPPQSLAGSPYFKAKGINPASITRPKTIFQGTARQAIKLFPANINVSAAISLAGLGPDLTRVQIIADPGVRRNVHTLMVEGAFGKMTAITENQPSPGNPKTSWLAVLSAMDLLGAIARERRRK